MDSSPVTPMSTQVYAWFASIVTEDYTRMDDLLADQVPVDVPHPLRHTTALMEATRRGNITMVQWLLARGATPALLCGAPMGTPLHCALRLHHVEIAELLIAPCETLAVLDSMGRTPLHVLASEACEYADPKHMLRLADQIIQRHCPLDTMDREGLTALHYAVIADHGGLVALLLERGANPNVAVPDTHMSPLGMVALDRNASLAALLLEFGANPHQRTRDGHTPVTLFPALGALAPQPGK